MLLLITRDDVARRAKTSSAVVSYVVNGGPRSVSEATRERVITAVQELGYRPNAVARALRSATSRVLGLIVPDIANPFFAELALSVETAAFSYGYSLFLGNARHNDQHQASYLRAFAEHQVQGLLLVGAAEPAGNLLPPATQAALSASGVPLVFLDRLPSGVEGAGLSVDNRDGAYQATAHLVGHGHRAVACLAGPDGLPPSLEREAGWAAALQDLGLDPDRRQLVRSQFDRHDAYPVARRLLARKARPRALFVHSDEQAIGVLHAAAALGVSVPHDLAVVSFDGIRESRLTHPALTTVQQPFELAGRRAVELVLERISAAGPRPTSEQLPVALVLRDSCGCSRATRSRAAAEAPRA